MPTINEDSTIGQQIKYHRRNKDVKQTDLGEKLGFSRDALFHIENRKMKLVDVNLIKGIIEELDIKDKLNINDDYIKFLMNNPCENLIKVRNKLNLTRTDFAALVGVSTTTARRWELGNNNISSLIFDKLMTLSNKKIRAMLV